MPNHEDLLDDKQLEVVKKVQDYLSVQRGVLLCMPVGSGKTRVTLQSLKGAAPGGSFVLCLVPATIIHQWTCIINDTSRKALAEGLQHWGASVLTR